MTTPIQMRRLTVLLLLSTVTALSSFAQTAPTWQWTRQTGGARNDFDTSVTLPDAAGNFCESGTFSGTILCGTTTLTSTSGLIEEMFLQKFDRQGNVVWAVQSRTTVPAGVFSGTFVSSTIADATGNTYLTGFFYGTVSFGPLTLTSQSTGVTAFLVKYSPQGIPLWASKGTGSGSVRGTGIALTPTGDIYWTGGFLGAAVFGSTTLTSLGGSDMFLVKLNSNGTTMWGQSAGGTLYDTGVSLAVDAAGGVYVNGVFSSLAGFGPLVLSSNGGWDIFIAQYNATGAPLFVNSFGGPLNDLTGGLSIAPTGEFYLLGSFQSVATFGSFSLASAGNSDGYALKCSAQGVPIWVRRFGGPGADACNNLVIHPSGALYANGFFGGTAAFDNQLLTSAGGTDAYVMRLTPAGTMVWVAQAGGPGNDYTAGLSYGAGGTVYLGGEFENTATFGPTSLTSRGQSDAFASVLTDNVPLATRSVTRPGFALALYPNPLSDKNLTLRLPADWSGGPTQVSITDAVGRVVHEQLLRASGSQASFELTLPASLVAGCYYVRCVNGQNVAGEKLLVR